MVGREASDDDDEGRLMAGRRFTIPSPSRAEPGDALAYRVLVRDAFTCVYCGVSGVPVEIDHVRPKAHFDVTAPPSRVNAPSNLVAACVSCNAVKGPQNVTGFAATLRGRRIPAAQVSAMKKSVRAATIRPLP